VSLFLARRWKQQPQKPLQVDWGNSLSRGLCAAWHPAARQYIGPGVATFPTPGTFAYQSDHTGGFGVRFNAAANSRIALPAGSAGTAGYSGTRLVLFRPYGGATGLVSGAIGGSLGMRLNGGATQIILVASGSQTVGSAANIPFSSGPTVALCTANDVTTETRMHLNGQLSASSTFAYASSSTGLYVGAITNQPSDANFFLALSWDRPLTLSESAAIQENAWQIFKPQQAVFYSLPPILFTAIDETVSDRNDYISATSRNAVYETTLSPITQPASGSDIVVNFDASSPVDTGSIKFDVLNGASVVKSHTVSLATNVGALYLPRRWKQQPQGAVRIDWGNGLSRDLRVALHPVNGRFYDITRYAAANASANASLVGSPSGIGLNGIGVTSDGGVQSQYSTFFPPVASYVVVGFSVDPYWHGISYVSHSLGGYGGGPNSSHFGVATEPYSLGRQVTFRLSTNNYDGAGNSLTFPNLIEQGKQFVYGSTRVAGANGLRAFSSGRFLGSADGGTGGIGIYSGTVDAGNAGYYGSGNTILMVAYWERALSDAEMVSVTSEPWQVFKPLTRRIVSIPRTVETSFSITPFEYSGVSFPWTPKIRVTSL
jgi:hypothetical protein